MKKFLVIFLVFFSALCVWSESWLTEKHVFVEYPATVFAMNEAERLDHVKAVLRNVETLKGVTYAKNKRSDKQKIFFEEAKTVYVSEDHIVALLTDSRSGENTYNFDYTYKDSSVLVEIKNETPIKFLGLTCLDKEHMVVSVEVTLTAEGIDILGRVELVDWKLKLSAIEDSIERRIDAITNWFIHYCKET